MGCEPTSPGSGRALTLLIVEDDAPALEVLRLMIPRRYPGSTIHLAGNGLAGLEQCLRWEPDIVITDIAMPGMDGLRMTETIKAWKAGTQVIVLTGYSDQAHLDQIRAVGADGHVVKPVDFARMYDAIGKCAAGLGMGRPSGSG